MGSPMLPSPMKPILAMLLSSRALSLSPYFTERGGHSITRNGAGAQHVRADAAGRSGTAKTLCSPYA